MRSFCMDQVNIQEEIKTNDFRPIDLYERLMKDKRIIVRSSSSTRIKRTYIFVNRIWLWLNDKTKGMKCSGNHILRLEPLNAVRFLRQIVEKTDDRVTNTKVISFLNNQNDDPFELENDVLEQLCRKDRWCSSPFVPSVKCLRVFLILPWKPEWTADGTCESMTRG